MSRYVGKKHGIIIGSDNVFFYRDAENKYHDFNAILWAQSFALTSLISLNCSIRTPADQLLWRHWEEERPREFSGIILKDYVNLVEPSYAARRWCDKHAPEWGCCPPLNHDPNPAFFFKRRGHALAMSRWIDETLAGCNKFGP